MRLYVVSIHEAKAVDTGGNLKEKKNSLGIIGTNKEIKFSNYKAANFIAVTLRYIFIYIFSLINIINYVCICSS